MSDDARRAQAASQLCIFNQSYMLSVCESYAPMRVPSLTLD